MGLRVPAFCGGPLCDGSAGANQSRERSRADVRRVRHECDETAQRCDLSFFDMVGGEDAFYGGVEFRQVLVRAGDGSLFVVAQETLLEKCVILGNFFA